LHSKVLFFRITEGVEQSLISKTILDMLTMDERAKFFFMERVPAEVLPSTVYLLLLDFEA
jgi:hypothetical protein